MQQQPVRSLVATGLAAAALALAGATPATATTASRVREQGSCQGPAHWSLRATGADSRIEVKGAVSGSDNGQHWTWSIRHNGTRAFHGRATARAPDGSFSITRQVLDLSGPDHIGWRARNKRTGDTCRGGLTF